MRMGFEKTEMAHAPSNVLADHLFETRSRTLDALWVLGFSLLTALAAQIKIPLPGTVVPLTGQTFAVLLSGAVLGARRGFASQALYLAGGALGLPVFAGGASSLAHLLGPTGGYLWSYPAAAAFTGWLVERGASRSVVRLALALFISDALILASGTLWLQIFFRFPQREAAFWGFYPFLVGDILKIVLVGLSLPKILERYTRLN